MYSSQASSTDQVASWFNNITPERILTDENKELCEGRVTFNECKEAVSKMKINKSPGLDGLSAEFYKVFWDDIGPILVDVYNECFDEGQLTDSLNLSVISLIFKDGDKTHIENYRPISLSNTDYKILAFVMANRVQNVIGNIIDTDQTAYIKGRYMGTNIRLVNDIIDHFEKIQKNGLMFFADFKKAFDSLNWNFMIKALQFLNFGNSFIRWINTIYAAPKACIKNNGYISDSFELHRGIKQGCPISALLFVIAVEVLAIQIRQSQSLKGYNFGTSSKNIKISQYADDCILFLNSKEELYSAINILQQFGNVSGLKLNTAKCKGLWIGAHKHLQTKTNLLGIKWPESLKYLGVYIGHNKNDLQEKNWESKLGKVMACLDSWSHRELSLFGKILIIKALAVSKLVMNATVLVIPEGFIHKLNKALFGFLWGKRDKVSRNKVIKNISDGGLNMIDAECMFESFKAKWMERIMSSNWDQECWTHIPTLYFNKFVLNNIMLNLNIYKGFEFYELKH